MKIEFERTGGFGGMWISATIDTESLPFDEAQTLRGMVVAADFFNLPATIRSQSPGADSFHYRVSIEAQSQSHTVEAGEGNVSDELRSLFRRLTVLARSR